ncbi:MAG: hypothetical protein ACRD4Q_07930 [Candidatus Acidiferrales bacterium]|nr:hypothetical protein [Candidatus Acidoferrales bacterium]
MSLEIETGRGRLVPTRPTGVQYQVEYTIKLTVEIRQHGRAPAASTMKWTKCSVRSSHAHFIPDGTYFLHADDGKVRQLKSTDGEWQCLATL